MQTKEKMSEKPCYHDKTTAEKLRKAKELVQEVVGPDFHGNVQFNLQPGRKNVNVKIEENIIIS